MTLLLPDVDILNVSVKEATFLTLDGEIETLPLSEAVIRVRERPPILCHRPLIANRLNCPAFPAFDILELFTFSCPTLFCLPTVRGIAEALELPAVSSDDPEETVLRLLDIVSHLFDRLGREYAQAPADHKRETESALRLAARGGWMWSDSVMNTLGIEPAEQSPLRLPRPWDLLQEWQDPRPPPPPTHYPVNTTETRAHLADVLGTEAEQRPQQADYASAAALAFTPRQQIGVPSAVLAEAGTGTGKTIAYIVPADLWARKNGATVWISTYTRNLQRQLDGELSRFYPDREKKSQAVAIRKGRENYLCLLNLEESLRSPSVFSESAFLLAVMCRWIVQSRDGDMTGGDFPGWLNDLSDSPVLFTLPDRRGECLFSACPHYRKCVIEAIIRKVRTASIVVANHALVMTLIGRDPSDETPPPQRYIFDEGHHLFDAADSAFSSHLTGIETGELRRWLLGAENSGRSRARGLKRRLDELAAIDSKIAEALEDVISHARCLPGPGWRIRLLDTPHGPIEVFLALVRQQVLARTDGQASPYNLETPMAPALPGLAETAGDARNALSRLALSVRALMDALDAILDQEAAELSNTQRQRINAAGDSLEYRALQPLMSWLEMLEQIISPASETSEPAPMKQVGWFALDRSDGTEIDIGMHRHWIDPTTPFASLLTESAHGFLITSATLRDVVSDNGDERSWHTAEQRCGALHLPQPALRATFPSPFDYTSQTRVFLISDVRRDNASQIAAAYRELFLASGGGALGLFTAIARLRDVYHRLRPALDAAGLPLFAQHIDSFSTTTLIDLFRAEEHACLLGTDAMRDGIDVPGNSLRLVVFDRIPWPRPNILHKARRAVFGGSSYDDIIVRMRLKQAFGRLIRRETDRGVFVLLDPMMPSRLKNAFPADVEIVKTGLSDAIRAIRTFLHQPD